MSENLYGEEYKNDMVRLQRMMKKLNCEQEETTISMNDFEVQQALGKGAYGNVYRVRNIQDGKDYALKQMAMSSNKDGIPQSVLREISVMKQLARKSHPNVLALKAVFHNVDSARRILKINLILERCDWDLYTFLRSLPRGLPDRQARHVVSQIVKGLDFLHCHNIIHRDLKPQNILVNRDQSIKIADFGLSKEYSNTTAFTTLVVTLWYRSPEILLQSYYNSTVDMWALGCIISELYNREPLFCAQAEALQLVAIFKKLGTPTFKEWPSEAIITRASFPNFPPNSLVNFNPYLLGDALDFVHKCLRYDPKKRLGSRQALSHPYIKPSYPKSRILKPIRHNK